MFPVTDSNLRPAALIEQVLPAYRLGAIGRCRLHATDGTFTEAGPGEALVIPAGFAGSFEVLETLRKHFVIVVGPETAAA